MLLNLWWSNTPLSPSHIRNVVSQKVSNTVDLPSSQTAQPMLGVQHTVEDHDYLMIECGWELGSCDSLSLPNVIKLFSSY